MGIYQDLFRGLNRAALIPFFVIGDPDEETCFQLVKTAIDAGADVLELGIPFSDPVADGPTIQKADFRAMKAGIEPGRIVYSGVGKTTLEMEQSLDAGILMFNIESFQELEVLNKIAGNRGLRAGISLRINPDVDPKTHPYVATGLKTSKFGASARLQRRRKHLVDGPLAPARAVV